MKKALSFGCKTLLLHNYIQKVEIYIRPGGVHPK
jgi:hypothetical protein